MGFNPRPSLLTSESRCSVAKWTGKKGFQSTPVIADERIADFYEQMLSEISFNPRPSLLTSESRPGPEAATAVARFQSTPVIADERIRGT